LKRWTDSVMLHMQQASRGLALERTMMIMMMMNYECSLWSVVCNILACRPNVRVFAYLREKSSQIPKSR
jgi:hypothetical protein